MRPLPTFRPRRGVLDRPRVAGDRFSRDDPVGEPTETGPSPPSAVATADSISLDLAGRFSSDTPPARWPADLRTARMELGLKLIEILFRRVPAAGTEPPTGGFGAGESGVALGRNGEVLQLLSLPRGGVCWCWSSRRCRPGEGVSMGFFVVRVLISPSPYSSVSFGVGGEVRFSLALHRLDNIQPSLQ